MSKKGFFAAKKAGLRIRHWKRTKKKNSANVDKSRISYRKHLESDYWKEVRALIHKRDKMICCMCRSVAENPEVHHVTYKYLFNEKKHLTNLILLCHSCHKKIHGVIK